MKSLLLAGLLLVSPVVSAMKIEVFTNDRHPVFNDDLDGITLYNLDDGVRAENTLPADLPADPEQAKQAALKMMQSPGFKTTMGLLKNYYDAQLAIVHYRLSKMPAIVIDETYVFYGMTDVGRAVEMVDRYREERE